MKHDIVIVGAGIVGLATALKIKEKNPGLKIAILEKEDQIALHQTGNNSGVIHSGIYYKPGSLKARNCLHGYELLLGFCEQQEIEYELCGKIIVATSEQELGPLENLYKRGIENGLKKIKKLGPEELKIYEPHVTGISGLHVPYTGIVDYLKVAGKMKELFEDKWGGSVFLNDKVTNISENGDRMLVKTAKDEYSAQLVINTAGLFSDKIARLTTPDLNVRIIPFRGEYYKLSPEKEYLVNNLIYPVPDPNFPFLGVHFTRMMRGGVEAGPNAVFAFMREGYHKSDISIGDLYDSLSWKGFRKIMLKYTRMGLGEYHRSFSKPAFTKALQRLVPEIIKEDLVPGGAGVRAQACDKNGNLIDDFLFSENEKVINVLNAPSPAATASLSIGESIAEKALARFAKN